MKPLPSARPILFSGPMILALLVGQKTQTRRQIKRMWGADHALAWGRTPDGGFEYGDNDGWHRCPPPVCPYGKPGSLLWVRETWAPKGQDAQPPGPFWFRADQNVEQCVARSTPGWKWRPAIHMPRAASRLTLRITDVRVESLQDIGQRDAEAEGTQFACENGLEDCHRRGFEAMYFELWDRINGAGSAAANPYVWAISFEVIHKNVDEVLRND